MEYRYEIGGKVYVMKPLVLGQVQQLMRVLENVRFIGFSPLEVLTALGAKLSEFLAVVLTPEGTLLKDKDVRKLAEELEQNATLEDALRVLEDFFDCMQITSVFQRIAAMLDRIAERMQLSSSSVFSQKET